MKSSEVSVIIPAYDEEAGIGSVLDLVHQTLQEAKINYEIIVVNDGSKDQTAAIAKRKKATVIEHPRNAGYGASVKDGILAARFKNVALIDADGTYPAKEIPHLLEYIKEGYDLVIGARTGKFYRYIWFKQPVRHIFKIVCEFVAGTKIPDPNSGLRIYKKSVILPLLNSRMCRGFSFVTSTALILILEGKFVKFVPIDFYARKGRSKIKFIRDALRASQILMETIVYYNPFKLFLLLAIFLALFMTVFLLLYLLNHALLLLVLFSLSFLSMIFVFCLGLAMSIVKKHL